MSLGEDRHLGTSKTVDGDRSSHTDDPHRPAPVHNVCFSYAWMALVPCWTGTPMMIGNTYDRPPALGPDMESSFSGHYRAGRTGPNHRFCPTT